MSLYQRMALQNIKKGHRFFIPRILTEAGLLACYYIVYTLMRDERLRQVKGGAYLPVFMAIGVVVIALLSIVLMFYTNSFLMKQRKREFGLYNVLGMEKRHVARVLLHESIISSLAGIAAGLVLGFVFYKLCSLFICRLLGVESILGFYYFSINTIVPSAVFFFLVDTITYIINCINIAFMKPVEMMASVHTGEKEPKVRWLMLILGILSLGSGYYLAVSVKNPLSAITFFFIAVILVMIGTYFLFITGTIFVLQALKKRKEYYYKPGHMTSVSGLLYRMKQNAVGLASICILATGVLVMISTTVSLYAGMEDMLRKHFPQEMYVDAHYEDPDGSSHSISSEVLAQIAAKAAADNAAGIEEIIEQRYLEVAFVFENGVCCTDQSMANALDAIVFYFMTAEDYASLTGERLKLDGNDIAFFVVNTASAADDYKGDKIVIEGIDYNITQSLDHYPIDSAMVSIFTHYGVVVSDDEVLDRICSAQERAYGKNASIITQRIAVRFEDRETAVAAGEGISASIEKGIREYVHSQGGDDPDRHFHYTLDSLWGAETDYSSMYGSFLFLGILLGSVCLFATALIIYYKQISEGYEDRSRYQIMQKIGMSQKEVKSSIGSQVMMVFFLPLIVAGIHICFAFPMLKKLLNLLLLENTALFVICTVITFLVFALVYVMIYGVTAKNYYRIVR